MRKKYSVHRHGEHFLPITMPVQHTGHYINDMNKKIKLLQSEDGSSYLRPFALVTSLFLLWGFAHGLLDVLDKHFQNTLHISKAESGFVQFSLYIAYLVMAYPAGV